MKCARILTVAVAAMSIVACTDNPNPTEPRDITDPPPPPPSLVTIAGRISVSGMGADKVVDLRDAVGTEYRLVGSQTGALASVDGGDVIARGTFDANPGFVVEDFQVTGMRGRPALDGVLEVSESGFALRLHDGSIRVIAGLPDECAQHIGARLWVIGFDDPNGAEFGWIKAQQ